MIEFVSNSKNNLGFALLLSIFLVAALQPDQLSAQEKPPGTVIVQTEDPKSIFVRNPSFAILPDGSYLATHEWHGDISKKFNLWTVDVLRSTDQGVNWERVSRLSPQCNANLFTLNQAVYMIGLTKSSHRLAIRCSTDSGESWTEPDENSGYLTETTGLRMDRAPVLIHRGRVWVSVDWFDQAKRRRCSFVISASIDDDLLDSQSWSRSNLISTSPNGFGSRIGEHICNGSVVPNGEDIGVVYRLHDYTGDVACLATVNEIEPKQFSLNATSFSNMPGGARHFHVRYDPSSKKYWSVVNAQTAPRAGSNRLCLISSDDAKDWQINYVIAYHYDGVWHGVSSPSIEFDGQDLVFVAACAWGGTPIHSKADKLIFKRLKDFRSLKLSDSPKPEGERPKVKTDRKSLIINGEGFEVKDLKEDESAYFFYAQYKWKTIPEEFVGWQFTRMALNRDNRVKVTAKKNTVVYLAVPENSQSFDITGWQMLSYSIPLSEGKSEQAMNVFARKLNVGEQIDIPQGGWLNALVLLPPDE